MKNKLSSRPQNSYPSHLWDACRKSRTSRELSYNSNPKHCENPNCNTSLVYDKRHLKYCSRKCSAVINNSNRSTEVQSRCGPEKTKFPCSSVTFRNCQECNKSFRFKKGFRKFHCSDACFIESRKSNISQYRKECKFNVNNIDHKELYIGELIEQYGWYSPSNKGNNLTGVSWDHLYRISDGFQNQIDPSIMSHPANAELVPHTINHARKTSQITYEELLERIKLWDSGNRNLINYYKKNGK